MDNKLEAMLLMQKRFQQKLGNDINSQEFKSQMALALTCEIMEALQETPWKPWRKISGDSEKFKDELIDCWKFLINLTLSSDMDATELFNRFCQKHKIIERRRENENN